MNKRFVFILGLLACAELQPAWGSRLERAQRAVVKINVTIQRYDYAQPWQSLPPGFASGSGFIIEKKRIMTNAHVISDAAFIEVQREGDARRFPAHVAYVAQDCDLALLEVEDTAFFEGTEVAAFHDGLPRLNDEVVALGYPMGGERLSLTRGVVSRIDYSLYSQSGVDSHLVIQTDAAINPGNSGGPVLLDGRVVGVAFQGMAESQNIGYAIPLPVIRHMLEDTRDGRYHGYPELGIHTFDLRNPALREALRVTRPEGGCAVSWIDPYGAARGVLRCGDVLLRLDGRDIAADGSVLLDGNAIDFTELIERRQWGDTVAFDLVRSGREQRVEVPLRNPDDPFCFRTQYDVQPEYCLVGGLVFEPVTRNLLMTLAGDTDSRAVLHLLYLSALGKIDGQYCGRTQYVILANRLPHPVNTYDEPFRLGVVSSINGRHISALRDLPEALAHPVHGFHEIVFEGSDSPLVMDAAALRTADVEISRRYGIPSLAHIREAKEIGSGWTVEGGSRRIGRDGQEVKP